MRVFGKNIGCLKVSVLLCTVGIMGIYILCLKQIPRSEPFILAWRNEIEWISYLKEIFWISGNSLWRLKCLMLSLFPFLLYFTVELLNRKLQKPNFKMICYYILLFIYIWIIEDLLVTSEFYRKEPLETFYLILLGLGVWCIMKDWNVSERKQLTYTLPIVLAVVLFWRHDRIEDILRSLQNPLRTIQSGTFEVNWLGYRLALFAKGWREDFSLMENVFAARVPENCPLVWIRCVGGFPMALLVLMLEIFLMYSLIILVRQTDVQSRRGMLLRVVTMAFLIKTVLGVAAELFLFTSTGVGLPLLRKPEDILWILFVAVSVSPNHLSLQSKTHEHKLFNSSNSK